MSLEMAPFSFFFFSFFLSLLRWACGRGVREKKRKRERSGMNVVGKLFGELINSLRDWKKRYYKGRGSSGVWKFFF